MQLRVRGERAVLVGYTETDPAEVDPRELALAPELSDALHEWARVAAAVRRARGEEDAGTRAPNPETAVVVSRRGHKLAGHVALELGIPVDYLDPVTETAATVFPHASSVAAGAGQRSWARGWSASTDRGAPTPWGTGLIVAGFIAVVVIVAMIALAGALSSEAGGWVALAAAAVVTAGLTPSLWLLRRMRIVRWIVLGAAVGVALSWGGVLVIAF